MASSLSKKDIDDLRLQVDKTVYKFLGFSEPSLVTAAVNCISSGYDKKKTTDKLTGLLDENKAARLAEHIFDVVKEVQHSSRRRNRDEDRDERDAKRARTNKDPASMAEEEMTIPLPGQPSPGQLTALQIKEMMVNAQRMIEERKKAMTGLNRPIGPQPPPSLMQQKPQVLPFPPPLLQSSQNGVPQSPLLQKTLPIPPLMPLSSSGPIDSEKAHKIAQLQAQIQSKLATTGIMNSLNLGKPLAALKPAPLILDDEGRTVDVTGKQVQLTQRMPTLKANIRAKKREEFKQQLQEKPAEEMTETAYFDNRVHQRVPVRGKRTFKFHDPGKFQAQAQRMRMKAQLEKLQSEISQVANRTGISSATKLAMIAPVSSKEDDESPEVEWWDAVLLQDGTFDEYMANNPILMPHAVTNLIEHPTQLKGPVDPHKPVFLPVFLTKKEQKKLRRQNRREAWKEKQEKIRLGLDAPPEPKVRMSNMIRVLGHEAIQDPTRIEAHVREQMAKRQKMHEEANAARKLTASQKREKQIRKIDEDTSGTVNVAVYRVTDLSNPSKKFKVETNAKQLLMTGCVVLFKHCNVIVVEGGPKQQKKYKRLMMNRIKWSEDSHKHRDVNSLPNNCALVWEGNEKQRHFGEIKFKMCPSEASAREYFKRHSVEHYWGLAYSEAVLEAAGEN